MGREAAQKWEEARAEGLGRSARLGKAGCPSIGVVTFNRKRADLIQARLQARAESNARFRSHYARELGRVEDMGFFVKNVENVQVDERDAIVFSTSDRVRAIGFCKRSARYPPRACARLWSPTLMWRCANSKSCRSATTRCPSTITGICAPNSWICLTCAEWASL
jgi:hypothetical protein